MRELVAYAFEAPRTGATQIDLATITGVVDQWLASKGTIADDGAVITLRDGRVGEIRRVLTQSSRGQIGELILTESTPGGLFRTSVSTSVTDTVVAVSVTLAAGSSTLSPHAVDVQCPRVVRSLLELPVQWQYQGTAIRGQPLAFRGRSGGDDFVALVWSGSRSLPVVAISDEYGAMLHPGIAEDLARDLAGLAIVGVLDPEASWRLTARKGKEWSCYGGAVRLYWPNPSSTASPLSAPLWTARRLLHDVVDTEAAATRLREQLRRRVFSQAAFAIAESDAFAGVRRAARDEELAQLRERTRDASKNESIAEEYYSEVLRLSEIIQRQEEELGNLRRQLANANLALQWRDAAPGDVPPVEETPPSTVEDAVLTAMERHADLLTFGDSVSDGIKRLTADAGPPDKILHYLSELAELTKARRAGPLGATAVQWLTERGVICSIESETIRNSSDEKRLRTWADARGGRQYFELHLKPNDGTSPDRCVRIYFDWDESTRTHLVGWVGRKPGL